MNQESSLLLPALRDMFPALPDDVLLAALDAHGNQIEGTIVSLLEMCADETGASETIASVKDIHRSDSNTNPSTSATDCKPSIAKLRCGPPVKHHLPAKTAWTTRPAPVACVQQQPHADVRSTHKKTWGQLRAEQQLQQQQHEQQQQHHHHHHHHHHQQQQHHPAPASTPGQAAQPAVGGSRQSPRYISPAAARTNVKLAAADFPDLPPTSAPGTARHASDPHDPYGKSSGFGPGASARICAYGQLPSPPIPSPQRGSKSYGKGTTCAYAQVARHAPQAMRSVGSWPRLVTADGNVYDNGGGRGAEGNVYDYGGGRGGGGMMYDNGRYAAAASDGGVDAEGWQAAALDELCRSHGWAGRDLVEAVCMALQYDLSEVVSALDELHAASYQDCRTGCSYSASPSSTASEAGCSSSGSGAEEDASEWEDDGQRQRRQPPHANRTRAAPSAATTAAAGSCDDFAAEAGCPRRQSGGVGHRARRRGGAGANESSGDAGDDAYSRHRGTALKLTHAWRKRMSKASAAFSYGDRALGRQLVAEAQVLRRQAAAAHEEAAERIEREMNGDRQLSQWELDLHGLHAEEAVQALARRIATLETGAAPHSVPANNTTTAITSATTTTATKAAEPSRAKPRAAEHAALPSAAPSSNTSQEFCSRRRRKPAKALREPVARSVAAFGATATTAAPRPPSSQDPSQRQVLASRRVLRVIVGKGLHSSGGEASLPRVVQGYLLQRGYRFTPGAGIIEVQLRRAFAASAGAVTVAQQHQQQSQR